MKILSIGLFYLEAKNVFRRFPVVCVNLLILTIFWITSTTSHWAEKIVLMCVLAVPLLVFLKLFSERRGFKKLYEYGLQGAGVLFLVIYEFWLPENVSAPYVFYIKLLLMALGFSLAVVFSPFLTKGEIKGFWQYTKTLILSFLATFIYTGAFYLGISAAVRIFDFLLGVRIDTAFYYNFWIIVVCALSAPYFLSRIPKDFTALDRIDDYPKYIKIFSQYILVPLTAIYFAILYVYTAKIIITGNWPEGIVVYLILVFSFLGLLAALLLRPILENGEYRWVKIFYKFFFIALIPMLAVLFWAIWIRVSDYGITESRYFVILLGLWLLGLAIYFLLSKSKNIKVVFVSLVVIALLSSFGPWGAFSVSKMSQLKRLEAVLVKNGVLIDGKIKKIEAEKEISFDDKKKISSIIDYFFDYHGFSKIKPWFSEDDLKKEALNGTRSSIRYEDTGSKSVMNLMGIEYVNRWKSSDISYETYRFFNYREDWKEIKGYDYLYNFSLYPGSLDTLAPQNGYSLLLYKEGTLKLAQQDGVALEIDLKEKAQSLLEERLREIENMDIPKDITTEDLTIETENEYLKVRIYIDEIEVIYDKNFGTEVDFIKGQILIEYLWGEL